MSIQLNDKVYDALKWICLILLPALGVLYTTLNAIWNFPVPTAAVLGTLSAIEVFLGSLLGISCANYNKIEEN